MSEEVLDAPEPIEAEVTDVTELVEDEQKAEEASESSPDTVEKTLTQADIDKVSDKLTKKRRAAERDRDYWREQAQKKEPEKPAEKVEEPVKTLEDFEYDEAKYQQHLFAKAREQAVDEAKRVLKEEQGQQTSARKVSEFRGREAVFSDSVDDYHDIVTNPELSISQAMADVAMEMETGPEVLYYLGKNPALADQIAQLPPLSAAREIGRIEAKLAEKPSGETVSKAPAPVPKIAATNPKETKSLDEMSQKDFNAARRKYIATHRG